MTVCDICGAEIKHDKASGEGPGYWYIKDGDVWKRWCQACYISKNRSH